MGIARVWAIVRLLAVCFGAVPWLVDRAAAGAFNIPQGQGLAIFDFTFAGGDRYFNGLGKLAPAGAFRRGDVSAYV